jgi:hypothetical protein
VPLKLNVQATRLTEEQFARHAGARESAVFVEDVRPDSLHGRAKGHTVRVGLFEGVAGSEGGRLSGAVHMDDSAGRELDRTRERRGGRLLAAGTESATVDLGVAIDGGNGIVVVPTSEIQGIEQ